MRSRMTQRKPIEPSRPESRSATSRWVTVVDRGFGTKLGTARDCGGYPTHGASSQPLRACPPIIYFVKFGTCRALRRPPTTRGHWRSLGFETSVTQILHDGVCADAIVRNGYLVIVTNSDLPK